MRLPIVFKPSLQSPLTLAWLAALWLGLLSNWPLWHRLAALPELDNGRGLLFVAAFSGIVVALLGSLLSLLAWARLLKPALMLLLIGTAALAYFIDTYGIVIDPGMIINMVQTDLHEVGDLLNLRLLVSLLLLGVLPTAWLWRRPLVNGPWGRRLGANLLSFAAGVLLMLLLTLGNFADLAATMRNHKSLRYMISPVNAIYSLLAVAVQSGAKPTGPPTPIGNDAVLAARPAGAKPPLLLLVVGETARAANFSLDGYGRPTNPELAQLPVLSFRQVSSCGTSTAASLPCMFSSLGREAFLAQKTPQENLLDLLQRAGLAVLWLDNQSGCKGVCERVPHSSTRDLPSGAPPLPAGLCDGEECMDEALLHGLDERLAALDPVRAARGVVLVMHQMGSHGPAYYKRSPAARKPFQPECTSNALQQCPHQQLVNAYDNSIAYTDHLLASAVKWLQGRQEHYDPSLLYVSDHGESLGENNLYLHGMPYAVAPREQTHVPMIIWLPEGSAGGESGGKGTQAQCLSLRLDKPLSHDNLFHTVLGIAGVQTQLYQPGLDLIASCRPG